MTRIKKINAALFRGVCLGFSLILLILTLLLSVKLTVIQDLNSDMEKNLSEQLKHNCVLRSRYENGLSLEVIERYAVEQLGMQSLRPGQIIYLKSDIE